MLLLLKLLLASCSQTSSSHDCELDALGWHSSLSMRLVQPCAASAARTAVHGIALLVQVGHEVVRSCCAPSKSFGHLKHSLVSWAAGWAGDRPDAPVADEYSTQASGRACWSVFTATPVMDCNLPAQMMSLQAHCAGHMLAPVCNV